MKSEDATESTPVDNFAIARSIQDRFCECENSGFNFGFESDISRMGKINRRKVKQAESKRNVTTGVQVDQDRKNNENLYDVQVVIPVYGASPTLPKCVESVAQSEGIVPYVTLVDNTADPGKISQAQEADVNMRVIKNKFNLGFGGGCEKGIESTDSEFVVLLNSDAIVAKDTLKIIVDVLRENDHVGACASVCVSDDGIVQEVGRILGSDGHTFGIKAGINPADTADSKTSVVPFASFVCVAIRKIAYEKVGGFDEEFFPAYSEDADLCLRLYELGYSTVVAHNAHVVHEVGESSSQLADVKAIKKRNREFLVEKHQSYFNQLPYISKPERYPHEFTLSRFAQFPERTLIVISDGTLIIEVLDDLKINEKDLPRHHVESITYTDGQISLQNNLSVQSDNLIEQYDGKAQLHHWLRDRIGLFNNVYLYGPDFYQINPQLLPLLLATQPFAKFKHVLQGDNVQ